MINPQGFGVSYIASRCLKHLNFLLKLTKSKNYQSQCTFMFPSGRKTVEDLRNETGINVIFQYLEMRLNLVEQ